MVLALLLAVTARPSDACRCAGTSIDDDFAVSAVVIVGNVVGKVKSDKHREHVIVVEVEGVWRGDDVKRTVHISTGRGGGDCGRGRQVTEGRWIFFASMHKGKLSTTICDSSQLATQEVLETMTKKFGKPKPKPKR